MDIKNFNGWMKLKARLHYSESYRNIREGEIWWYAAGENIRTEINGKSKRFSRPVLVVKKFGRYSFWGVPLTTKQHTGDWYASFEFHGRMETAAVHQMRYIDVSRLYDRIGQVPDQVLSSILDRVVELLNKKVPEKMCPNPEIGGRRVFPNVISLYHDLLKMSREIMNKIWGRISKQK